MKLMEMILDLDAIANGVDAVSLVESPAIESNFVALSKPVQVKFKTLDEEKRLVLGPVLIPNKPILRLDEEGKPYNIFFSDQTVRDASQLYLKRGFQNQATLEHNIKLQGVTMVESWIVEDTEKDKSALYDLNAPVGSWVGAMKIENDDIWNDYVKEGKVLGFSIEGFFEQKETKLKAKILKKL